MIKLKEKHKWISTVQNVNQILVKQMIYRQITQH